MALIDAWLRLDSFEKKTLCLRLWKRKRRRISWLLGTCSFFDCLLSGPASARAALRLGRRKCGRRLPRGYLKRLGLEVERGIGTRAVGAKFGNQTVHWKPLDRRGILYAPAAGGGREICTKGCPEGRRTPPSPAAGGLLALRLRRGARGRRGVSVCAAHVSQR